MSGEEKILRHTFAVAILAQPGVDVGAIEALAGGGSLAGFGVLKRDEVLNADDDAEAAEKKKELEGEEKPIPPELFGMLLKSVLNRPGEAPPPPDGDDSASVLMRTPRGPRQFLVCTDMPVTMDEVKGLADGGGFDMVVLVERGPGSEGAEGGEETDPDAISPEETDPDAISPELLFEMMQGYAMQQTSKAHNATSDSAFVRIVDSGNPEEVMDGIARSLVNIVTNRVEYMDWLEGVHVVQSEAPAPPEMRHYIAMLEEVPNESTSVAVVLHALCEQVALSAADQDGSSQDDRELWRSNRAVMECCESSLSKLALQSNWSHEELGPHQGAAFAYGDRQAYRLGEASLKSKHAQLVSHVEETLSTRLNIVGRMPEVSEEETSRLIAKDTSLFKSLSEMDPGAARRGLILCEFEQMLGYAAGSDGKLVANEGWGGQKGVNLHEFEFVEELSDSSLQQTLADALLGQAEVIVRPYEREDLLLVALCNLVPTQRYAKSFWRSDLSGCLGFWQWYTHLRPAADDGRQEAHKTGEYPGEPLEADAVVEGEARGEGEEGEEVSTSVEKERRGGRMPLPRKPGKLYDLDADKSALFVEEAIVYPHAAPPIRSGRTRGGRFARCTLGGHSVSLREDQGCGDKGVFAVSVAYLDGAVVLVRRQGGQGSPLQLSMSTSDGQHLTMRGGGHVWQGVGGKQGPGPGCADWQAFCAGGAEPGNMGVYGACVLEGGEGLVVRRMDGSAECMMPDGCHGRLTPMGWEWTNSQGKRQGQDPRFPGVPQYRDAIRAYPQTNGLTGDVCVTREDGVLVYTRGSDSSRLAQFPDGSRIATLSEGQGKACAPAGLAEIRHGPGEGEVAAYMRDGTVARLLPKAQGISVTRSDGSVLRIRGSVGEEEFVFSAESEGAGRGLGEVGGEQDDVPNVTISMLTGHVEVIDCSRTKYKISDLTVQVTMPGSGSVGLDTGGLEGEEPVQGSLRTRDSVPDSWPGPSRLEPYKLFCIRRDGSGFEMLHRFAARASLRAASSAGAVISQKALPNGGMLFRSSVRDGRWVHRGGLADELVPRAMMSRGLGPTGGLGSGAITVRDLEYHPGLAEDKVHELRKALERIRIELDAAMACGKDLELDELSNPPEKLKALYDEIEASSAGVRPVEEVGSQAMAEEEELLEASVPPPQPPLPTVQRPPARFQPSIYKGVNPPDEPQSLRPGYFDQGGSGAEFLESLPHGERSEFCSKPRYPGVMQKSSLSIEEDPDEENNNEGQQEVYGGHRYDYERVNTGQDWIGGDEGRVGYSAQNHSSSHSHAQHERPKPTTAYHRRDLKSTHFDVLNRPRKQPIPNTDRHDAVGDVNLDNSRVELPVRRHTHTSSVLQRTRVLETQRLQGQGLNDSLDEEGGNKMFRLRPKRASFGNVKVGAVFRHKLVISNIGVELARYRVRQPERKDILSVVYTPGGMAAGMSVVLEIEIFCEEPMTVDDELGIETEAEIFSIPISATVLAEDDFAAWEKAGGVLPKHVKCLNSAPKRALKSKPPKMATLVALKLVNKEVVVADLQDPVKEPKLPALDKDWVVDMSKTLADIKEMTAVERKALRDKVDAALWAPQAIHALFVHPRSL